MWYAYDPAGRMLTEMFDETDDVFLDHIYIGNHRIATAFEKESVMAAGPPQGPELMWARTIEWFSTSDTRWWGLGAVSLVILMGVMSLVLSRWLGWNQAIGVSFFIVFGLGSLMLGVWPRIKPAQATHNQPANTLWHHYDWLKRPVALTYDSGVQSVAWRAMYNPYGETVGTSDGFNMQLVGGPDYEWEPSHRFLGQYEDLELQDLDPQAQNWNRMYLPALGRYQRTDAVGLIPPGLTAFTRSSNNLYGYAANNTYVYVDEDGRIVGPLIRKALESLIKKLMKQPFLDDGLQPDPPMSPMDCKAMPSHISCSGDEPLGPPSPGSEPPPGPGPGGPEVCDPSKQCCIE